MEELATVVKKKKKKAEVKITRYSVCSKCDKSCSLAGIFIGDSGSRSGRYCRYSHFFNSFVFSK